MFSYCVSNSNIQIPTNQAFYKENFYLLLVSKFRGGKKRVLEVLLKWDTIRDNVQISRGRIASESGLSIRQVSRCLNDLESLGLIRRVRRRDINKSFTNDYTLHPIFHTEWSRRNLGIYYPILRWVDPEKLELKKAISTDLFSKNVTLYINDSIREKKSDSFREFLKGIRLKKSSPCTVTVKSENDPINFPLLFKITPEVPSVDRVLTIKMKPVRKERQGVPMLDTLRAVEGFGNYEITQLSTFSQEILTQAYSILQRTEHVSNRFKYMHGICKQLVAKQGAKPYSTAGSSAGFKNRYSNESRSHYGPDKSPLPPMKDGKYTVQPGDKGMPVGCTIFSRKYYEQLEDESRHLSLQSSSTPEVEHPAVSEEIIWNQEQRGSLETNEINSPKVKTLKEIESLLGDKFSPYDYYVDG